MTFEALQICPEHIFRQMGYGRNLPEHRVLAETDEVMGYVSKIVKPRFCYVVKRGDLDERSIRVGEVTLSIGEMIARQLRESEAFAFFVATVGMEFERYQRQLSQDGNIVRAYIADVLGSLMAERIADMMEQALQESIDKLGWRHTNRFSPGYCHWPIDEQPLLFSLIGERPCDIGLNEGCLMTPIKSVSGVIGVGQKVARRDYACAFCLRKDCVYRKRKA